MTTQYKGVSIITRQPEPGRRHTLNDYGVCTDPQIVYQLRYGRFAALHKIAELEKGRWYVGIVLSASIGGRSVPVDRRGASYSTAEAAASECVFQTIEFFLGEHERRDSVSTQAHRDAAQRVLEAIEQHQTDVRARQLALFGDER